MSATSKPRGRTFSIIIGIAVAVVRTKIEGMIEIISGIVAVVRSTIAFVKALFEGDWKAAWEALKDIVAGVFDTLIGFVKLQFGNIIGTINGLAGAASIAAENFAKGIANSLYTFIVSGVNAMIGVINGVIDKINDFSIAGVTLADKVGLSMDRLGEISAGALFQMSTELSNADRWTQQYNTSVDEQGDLLGILSDSTQTAITVTNSFTGSLGAQTTASDAATAAIDRQGEFDEGINRVYSTSTLSFASRVATGYEAGGRLGFERDRLKAAESALERLRGSGASREEIEAAEALVEKRQGSLDDINEAQAEMIRQGNINRRFLATAVGNLNRAGLNYHGRSVGVGHVGDERVITVNYNQNAPVTVDAFREEVVAAVSDALDLGGFRGRLEVVTK